MDGVGVAVAINDSSMEFRKLKKTRLDSSRPVNHNRSGMDAADDSNELAPSFARRLTVDSVVSNKNKRSRGQDDACINHISVMRKTGKINQAFGDPPFLGNP